MYNNASENCNDLSYEDIGTIGGALIGLDISSDYGWQLSPINGNSISDITMNTAIYLMLTIGGSIAGGVIGGIIGHRFDNLKNKKIRREQNET